MIRTQYSNEEDLKRYENYGIVKTEVVTSEYGDRKYVTFGVGLLVGYGSDYLGDCQSWPFARVWNPVTLKEDQVGYENTERDATPEVISAWEAWKKSEVERINKIRREELIAQRKYEHEQELLIPRRGKVVRVVKGRKVPKGTEGRVFWYGTTQYGRSVGIELNDGTKVFTAEYNVLVIAQEEDGTKEVVIHTNQVHQQQIPESLYKGV